MGGKPDSVVEDRRVGRTIRAFRNSRGLSAAELAEIVGKSEPLIHAIERGTRHATPQVTEAIAAALRVHPGAIVRQDEDEDAA